MRDDPCRIERAHRGARARSRIRSQAPTLREAHRRFHHDVAHQIAVRGTAQSFDAFATQPKYLADLRFGGNIDFRMTIEGRDFDLAAQRRSGETHRHFTMQIAVFAREHWVRLDVNDHIKIAGRPAAGAAFTFTR